MGCIDSDKSNPVYLVGAYCKKPGWNYPSNGVGEKYGFIFGLKELLLLNSISQTITNKKEKSNNKQKEKKKIKTKPILRLT